MTRRDTETGRDSCRASLRLSPCLAVAAVTSELPGGGPAGVSVVTFTFPPPGVKFTRVLARAAAAGPSLSQ
jgi:hypothetical protein